MKPLLFFSSILLLALFSAPLLAEITLTTVAETEVTEVDARGEEIVRRTRANRVVPGSEVIYTITAKNSGAEPADNVVVTNPIPEQTVYVDGSAFGAGTEIIFSADGGKHYDAAGQLTVKQADGLSRAATGEDYTHVRWHLAFSLAPGEEAPVGYVVRVK
ncbi:hypothetical protein [Thiohalomonas denitrificans]|uniref:hypothetical protein n=1 Tax=Thiohalomonas denitrificans TaxID=415747 RepID=UPI0026EB30D1|nr:hypothetical protein [Thiohalomonas denitrificans]